jgi:GTP-binding protein
LSATIGINTSPLTGLDGKKLTARMIKDRLESELIGNVSINILPSDRPDSWIFQGRGELQLAVLVETMRREGFEMTVGKPEVVTKMIDGKLHEPMERLAVDIQEEHLGAVTQLLAHRKGKMVNMVNHGDSSVSTMNSLSKLVELDLLTTCSRVTNGGRVRCDLDLLVR